MRTLLALSFSFILVSSSFAQDSKAEKSDSAKPAVCEGQCPVATGLKALPQMHYKVNGKLIDGCIKCATAASKESGKPIMYVVGKKEFEAEGKAKMELLSATEKMVKAFATPHKCEVSQTTTIGGKKCSCPVEAAERTKLVSTAISKVKMNFKVGDQTCDCPVKATELAKTSGHAKEFVVGKTCTACETTAKLELARAQYKAALEAVAKLEKK